MLINGIEYSFANVELQSNGLILPGIKSINYKDSVNREKIRGSSSLPLGYTEGEYDADGDIEVYRSQHEVWKASLGGPGFMQRKVFLTISYAHPELPVIVDTVVALIGSNESAGSSGPAGSTIKHTLFIPEAILWNGVPGVLALF